jgi:Mg-chelatase subunit ChlD
LLRKPKELAEPPTALEPAGGGIGSGVFVSPRRRREGTHTRQGSGATVMTEDAADVVVLSADGPGADPAVRAAALMIAGRLSIPRPRRDSSSHRGAGLLQSVPYRAGLDDIDLDRTLDVLAESPAPEDEDIIVRERVRTRRSVVLAVDVSGSMRGERIRTAAATVGALAGELARDDLAVLAFWSDAAWLAHLGTSAAALELVDALLQLPAKGLTNVAFPLELAAHELARIPARDARVVLLSDCVHNAGPDPRPLAAGLPRLDILLDVTGEHDLELGREMARLGRGRAYRINDHRDVAPALTDAFAP